MITSTRFESLRERIHELTAGSGGPASPSATTHELGVLALLLHSLLEQSMSSEMRLRATQAELVAACRATVAAARQGELDPLVHVEHQLEAHGWMPAADARPAQLLAAVSALRPLLAPGVAA
ncbi:hypothetical protein [Nonomuraea sp. NPDC048916]|uniref:hypothetical protein n=1 Tax=Nonomuraea sp. NPDC048916 TaxID=3154232 RepID=UPI00340E78A1